MRTTIEMRPEHRARILELAATRGEKGFSQIIAEALDIYLDAVKRRDAAIALALALKGSLPKKDAEDLAARTLTIREQWR